MRTTISELLARIDDLEAGLYRAPIGPGGIRGKQIAPKTVTAGLINVSNLESVNTKTGSLSVTGGITLTNAGTISAGMSSYNTGVGYWIDNAAGTPRFSLGNSGGSNIRWDGTTLSVTGTITATAGAIGGFTIGSTDLQGSGGVIGLASSGSIRIWSGSATPSAAAFQVDSLGNLTATAGFIGGLSIDSTLGLKLGSTTNTRGISTGATAFYAGSATPSTAPFHVNTNGDLVATSAIVYGTINTGNITASGGTIGGITINAGSLTSANWSVTSAGVMTSTSGTIGGLTIGASSLTIPAGKTLTNADGDTWSSTGITLVSAGSFGDSIKWSVGGVDKASIYADSTKGYFEYSSGGKLWVYSNGVFLSHPSGGSIDVNNAAGIIVSAPANQEVAVILGDSAGARGFNIYNSGSTRMFAVNSLGDLVRPIANDATALGAYFGRVPIYINGALKYLSVYS